jgi:hypothetical protein
LDKASSVDGLKEIQSTPHLRQTSSKGVGYRFLAYHLRDEHGLTVLIMNRTFQIQSQLNDSLEIPTRRVMVHIKLGKETVGGTS